MGKNFSIYFLSPDRRFVEGTDSFPEALSRARQLVHVKKDSRGNKVESVEVWDNNEQKPVFGVERKWGGKLDERFAEGYKDEPAKAAR